MRRISAAWALALLLPACRSSPVPAAPVDAPSAAALAVPATDEDASNAAIALDAAGGGGVYAELPPLDEPTLELSSRFVGFTKDDVYLGYAVSRCDPCPLAFEFKAISKPPISLSYFFQPGLTEEEFERRQKKNDEAVDIKLAKLGVERAEAGRVLRGPFPDEELRFAVDVDAGSNVLLFGAHVPGEPPVYPMHLDVGAHPMARAVPPQIARLKGPEREKALHEFRDEFTMDRPRLAYANVTRDGREIGAVAIAPGAMWYESAVVARMPTSAFVAEIYEGTAKGLAGGNDARAEALMDKARALLSSRSSPSVPAASR
jgi:hypothetical protein